MSGEAKECWSGDRGLVPETSVTKRQDRQTIWTEMSIRLGCKWLRIEMSGVEMWSGWLWVEEEDG